MVTGMTEKWPREERELVAALRGEVAELEQENERLREALEAQSTRAHLLDGMCSNGLAKDCKICGVYTPEPGADAPK